MVNYPHNNLFNIGDTKREIKIEFNNGVITNKEMHQGSFELKEKLLKDKSLVFGRCEASVLKFKVHNVVTSLKGKTLTVYEILNGNTAEPFYYGKYKVQSDKPTADRKYREIVAYDAMYDILNADVTSWYNNIKFPCTIGYLRKKLLAHLKIEEVETELVNDGIYIQKTIDTDRLTGKDVITRICELNGCFGHINRQGKFEYIVLNPISTGLYPIETLYPSETLYPKMANSAELLPKSRYSSCKYQDFETQFITGVQIRQEEDDVGATVGTLSNLYVVEDNFLVYGKNDTELKTIGNNLLSVIDNVYYRPIDYVKTSGKPYLEVGDNISVGSSEVIIETYILERTISGLNGQKDEFSAKGTEIYENKANSLQSQITKLKGKTNKLTRTVDETRLEMADMENELYATISVTAKELRTEFENTADNLKSQIKQTADEITLSVENLDKEISSQIRLLSDEISLKVSSDEVQSMIDVSIEGIQLTADQINLEGYTTINGGFEIFTDGKVIIRSDDGEYSCQMGITGLDVSRSGSSIYSGVRDDGFFLYDLENEGIYSVIYREVDNTESTSKITIGFSNYLVPCEIYADSIQVKGSEVITEENIFNYIGEDLTVNSISGNDEYSSIAIANANFTYAYTDQLDAFEIFLYGESLTEALESIRSRLDALES